MAGRKKRGVHNVPLLGVLLLLVGLAFRALFAVIFLVPAFRRHRPTVLVTIGAMALETAAIVAAVGHRSSTSILVFCLLAAAATLFVAIRIVSMLDRRTKLRITSLAGFLLLTPSEFELAVCDLLHDLGYREISRVGRSGDLAADIICKDDRGKVVAVQCKRHAPGIRVGSGDIQTFIGMLTVHHGADTGIFVTTSEFTAPAKGLAKQHGLYLIDGSLLGRLAVKLSHSRTVAKVPQQP